MGMFDELVFTPRAVTALASGSCGRAGIVFDTCECAAPSWSGFQTKDGPCLLMVFRVDLVDGWFELEAIGGESFDGERIELRGDEVFGAEEVHIIGGCSCGASVKGVLFCSDAARRRYTARVADSPLLSKILALSESVPDEALEGAPTDMAANHDHYLYGHDCDDGEDFLTALGREQAELEAAIDREDEAEREAAERFAQWEAEIDERDRPEREALDDGAVGDGG